MEVFYEAMGHLIHGESDPKTRNTWINELTSLPNQQFVKFTQFAKANQQRALCTPEHLKQLRDIVRLNKHICKGVKHAYLLQFGRIFGHLLSFYKFYSTTVNQELRTNPGSRGADVVRLMCTIKCDILDLIDMVITTASPQDHKVLAGNFVTPFLQHTLLPYQAAHEYAREHTLLSVYATLFNTFGEQMINRVKDVLQCVFWPTLTMIQKNQQDFPDHQRRFFQLLKAINAKCFEAFYALKQNEFITVLKAIIWAVKSMDKNVHELGLQILHDLLTHVETSDGANDFFKNYLMDLLNEVFGVLTDTLHKAGFDEQTKVLAKIFTIVEAGVITTQLWNPQQDQTQYRNNMHYVQKTLLVRLVTHFKRMDPKVIERTVIQFFNTASNLKEFRVITKDFLVLTKQWHR